MYKRHLNKTQIEAFLHSQAQLYDNLFIKYYGSDKSVWPIRIVMELPLMISEREYHCTANRAIMVNQVIHEIFEIQHGWKVFPLLQLSKAIQYDYTAAKDGLHPIGVVLNEMVRIFFELLIPI